ncbi:MAG: hypothetical protein AW12_02406 [Candidatus Accumulibacter sp. BA-94]|nr:MAG: hypothetical protein AW12_02406 [Candidatus Accumulibacter sp. BA-94]
MAESREAGQTAAFGGDGLGQRELVAGQWMTTTGFRIALDQGGILRIEEQELQFEILFSQHVELQRQRCHAVAAPDVDDDADLVVALQIQLPNQRLQQLRRQVVDTIVVGVLEHLEGDRFAGTGQAADENEMHVGKHNGWPAARASCAALNS